MSVKHKQYPRRWVGRTAAAVAVCAGLVAAPTSNAVAVTATNAFAYQVVDCSTPGTDYGVALGTPDKPIGPVQDKLLRADVYNGAKFVMPIQLRSFPNSPNTAIRWATVPPDVEYTFVRFYWTQDGKSVDLQTPAPKPEVCAGPKVTSGPTNDPGAGLVPVAPVRLYDSRNYDRPPKQAAPVAGLRLSGELRLDLGTSVPNTATAAMLNVTAANPAAAGFLTVYPCDVALPRTSNVNYIAGETRAGSVFTKLSAKREVCIFASAPTDVVIDLNGYVADSTSPAAMTPIRVVDTRAGERTDVAGTPKGKTTFLQVPVAKFGVADASDLIVNITTVGADAPGHISLSDCAAIDEADEARASVVNYVPGRAQANLAFAHPIGDMLCIEASAPTHIIVDLVGATKRPSSLLGSSPSWARLLDTRVGQKTSDGQFQAIGQLKANVPLKLKVRDRLYAEGATAAALNITAARESAYGHITVYPCGGKAPVASNLNYVPGVAIANVALTKLDAQGNVCIVSHVDTDLVVDLAAVNSTSIQSEGIDPITGPGFWSWGAVRSTSILGQRGDTIGLLLAGGAPPYTLSGPTVSGLAAKLSPTGRLTVSVADDAYVIADPVYTLSGAGGTSQTVTIQVKIDPQFSYGTFPVP